MSEILSNRRPDDGRFGLVPAYSGSQTVDFQANKGPNGEGDVAHLPTSRPDLRFLDTTALLDTSMVALDRPGSRPGFPGQLLMLTQTQVIGGPSR